MRRIVLLASLLSMILVLFSGVASAQYNSQDDQTINVNVPINLPNLNTAMFTFNTQESIHQSVFKLTDTSVNHFYIWINVNNQPVAAVDPAKVMY
jgi:hypothetical protein